MFTQFKGPVGPFFYALFNSFGKASKCDNLTKNYNESLTPF